MLSLARNITFAKEVGIFCSGKLTQIPDNAIL